jgi:WD40 repeat protein
MEVSIMPNLTTFHLYHHQPGPLPSEAAEDRAWLINNAFAYSVVAVIDAPSVRDALQAAQCKAQARTLPRSIAVRAGNLLRETLPGDVLVTRNDAWMVVGDTTSPVRKISYEKSPTLRSFGQRSTVDGLAWSPDGRLLAVAENDNRVVLRTLEGKGDYPTAYTRGQYAAEHLAWSLDGTRLASGGSAGEVHVWQPAPWRTNGSHSGYMGSILICGHDESDASYKHIHCLSWTPDGNRIVAGREDGCLLSWNAHTGQDYQLQKRHTKAITSLAFSPREPHLMLTGSADTMIHISDEESAQERVRYQHAKSVLAAVWSPDGNLIASCEKEDPTVHVWSSQTGDLLTRIPLSIYTTEDLTIRSLAWSADGAFLAAGCDDRTVQLIDLALYQHVQTYWTTTRTYQGQTVYALAWSPDSTLLASGGSSASVDVWQVRPFSQPHEEVTAPLVLA